MFPFPLVLGKEKKMFNDKEKKGESPKRGKSTSSIAKKDFRIKCNDDDICIKKGEKVDVPAKYLPNLKTEGVI